MMAGRYLSRIGGFMAVALAFGATPASAQDAAPEAKPEAQVAEEARIKAAAKVLQRSIDAWRAGDFEGWINSYSPNVVLIGPQMEIAGRDNLRKLYRIAFDVGIPAPTILESGWTGERIYVRQLEQAAPDGPSERTYAEYEIKDGLITAVIARMD